MHRIEDVDVWISSADHTFFYALVYGEFFRTTFVDRYVLVITFDHKQRALV